MGPVSTDRGGGGQRESSWVSGLGTCFRKSTRVRGATVTQHPGEARRGGCFQVACAGLQTRIHLPALTSLRGLAAVWVVFYHFQDVLRAGGLPAGPLTRLIGHGHYAVDLFFLLSGYVIAYNYLDVPGLLERRACFRFLVMRLARIYPAHLVGLLAVLPMVVVARVLGYGLTEEGYGLVTFLQHLTLTQAWVPFMKLSWNYPAWSVSAEWFAYLCFPLLAVLLRRVRGVAANVLLLGGCAGVVVFGFFTTPQAPFGELLRVLATFPVGMALFHISRTLRPVPWLPRLVALASFAGLALALMLDGVPHRLFFVLFATLLWGLAGLRPGELSALCSRPLVWLGEISYSLYISHALVQKVLNEVFPAQTLERLSLAPRMLGLGLYAGLLLASGYGLWRLVEEPSRRGLKRLLDRKSLDAPPVIPPVSGAGA